MEQGQLGSLRTGEVGYMRCFFDGRCRQERAREPYVREIQELLQLKPVTPFPMTVLVVPQIYTIWNFRREALTPVFEAGGEGAQIASQKELALTQVRNPGLH